MAFATTTADFGTHHSVTGRFFAALGRFGTAYVEARSRHNEFAALEALSDEELAERGLTRDDIARHVFADMLYL